MTSEEVARLGMEKYEAGIQDIVETEENIGKMIIIDVETGEYVLDARGLESSRTSYAKSPGAALYGIRIGYNVAAYIGGAIQRLQLGLVRLHGCVAERGVCTNRPTTRSSNPSTANYGANVYSKTGSASKGVEYRATAYSLGLSDARTTPQKLGDKATADKSQLTQQSVQIKGAGQTTPIFRKKLFILALII